MFNRSRHAIGNLAGESFSKPDLDPTTPNFSLKPAAAKLTASYPLRSHAEWANNRFDPFKLHSWNVGGGKLSFSSVMAAAGFVAEKPDNLAVLSIRTPRHGDIEPYDTSVPRVVMEFDDDWSGSQPLTRDQAKEVVDFLRQNLAADRHLLVHCELGANRSPAIATALYVHYHESKKLGIPEPTSNPYSTLVCQLPCGGLYSAMSAHVFGTMLDVLAEAA